MGHSGNTRIRILCCYCGVRDSKGERRNPRPQTTSWAPPRRERPPTPHPGAALSPPPPAVTPRPAAAWRGGGASNRCCITFATFLALLFHPPYPPLPRQPPSHAPQDTQPHKYLITLVTLYQGLVGTSVTLTAVLYFKEE